MTSQQVVFRPAKQRKTPDLTRPRPVGILGWCVVKLADLADGQGGLVVLILLALCWWLLPFLVYPAALSVVLIGAWIGRRRHLGELPRIGWLTGLRTFTLSAFLAVVVLMWALTRGGNWSRLGVVVCLLTVEALLWQPRTVEHADWWRHNPLRDLLVAAAVIPKPTAGERLPKLRYIGTPTVEPTGVEVIVELPEGVAATAAVKAHEAIAARIPGARNGSVVVDAHEHSIRTVRIWCGARDSRPGTRTLAPLDGRQDARQPAVVARDRRGKDTPLGLTGRHTLVIGATGSGKTTGVRALLRTAVLDPTALIVPLIYKDDPEDWRDGLELFCGEVSTYGLDRAGLEKSRQVLEWLTRENNDRGTLRLRKSAGPIVVLVEEWAAGRIAMEKLDPELARDCDGMLSQLLMTMRSRGMSAVILSQRGTVTYVPGDQKINAAQRFVGLVPERRDAASILDVPATSLPALPAGEGEFLHVDIGSRTPQLIRFDYMDDDAWLDVCREGARLRTHAGVSAPTLRQTAASRTAQAVAAPAVPVQLVKADPAVDELELAVLTVLGQDGPMLASTLYEQLADFDLPSGRTPADARALGVELGHLERRGVLCRTPVGKNRGWAVATPAGTPGVFPEHPRAARPRPPQNTPGGGTTAVPHARPATGEPVTPAA